VLKRVFKKQDGTGVEWIHAALVNATIKYINEMYGSRRKKKKEKKR
jgi:hypothetical protein